MPTLEELFRSKQLPSQGGQTAEEAYAIQNSKKIRISSSNPLVSTVGMLPAKGARALLGIRKDESLLEEELTGLRMIRTGSIPFIYGSDLGRLTLRSTDSLQTMKDSVGSVDATEATGAFAKIGDTVNKVKSELGIPVNIIPTRIKNGFTKEDLENPNKRYEQLERIKSKLKGTPPDGLLGFIGRNAGGGTPDAMGRNLVGGAIKEGKQALAQKVFGSRAGGKLNTNSASATLSSGIKPPLSNLLVTKFTEKSLKYWGKFGFNYGMLEPSTPPNDLDDSGTPTGNMLGAKYSKTIDTTLESTDGLSAKQIVLNVPAIKFSEEPERKSKFETSDFDSKIVQNENYKQTEKSEFLETKRGMYTISDLINTQGVYEGETKKIGDTDLDEFDFITLKFTSLGTKNGSLRSANFRATITGLSETFSPSWDSGKFVGSPFSYYTYGGIERSVTFNFKVYSLNAREHKIAWDKLNFLAGLVYPADYYGDTSVKAPIIKFTLGDMYKGKAGFIESLSYTFDDNTPWQVMDKENTHLDEKGQISTDVLYGTKKGISQNPQNNEINMKGYKLPTIADVAVTIKFIENRNLTGIEDGNRKFYTFTPQT